MYNLLVVYAFVQALVLILMLCSFIQRWSVPASIGKLVINHSTDFRDGTCLHAQASGLVRCAAVPVAAVC